MCGIFCSISQREGSRISSVLEQRLRARGPDSWCTVTSKQTTSTASSKQRAEQQEVHITLCATVLSLRGSKTTVQPLQADDRFVLCWNGEAWSIDGERVTTNDTYAVLRLLSDAISHHSSVEVGGKDVASVAVVAQALSVVAGPYAFVLYDRAQGRLYFGRDFLGRRSLLWKLTSNGEFSLSSVPEDGSAGAWMEVEADGVYCIHLNSKPMIAGGGTDACSIQTGFHTKCADYVFSGNAENVGSVLPKLSLCTAEPILGFHLDKDSISVGSLHELLRESLSFRVENIPEPPKIDERIEQSESRLAVLFSGGIDCTILARIAHELLPKSQSIDLLNVAFENPRVAASRTDFSAFEACPDRITGRKSLAELRSVCPGREFRFVTIDIIYSELLEHREEIISLMHPHNTEMDLSIACALYFAARGSGRFAPGNSGSEELYTTAARVLLSGLGADELFAGYTRHATAFRHRGASGLIRELQLDVARLGKRNLGRDDRVLSHWGREVRFPYLDERLLAWALAAPVQEKCGFMEEVPKTETDGSANLEPGKKILRCLAVRLGMNGVASEKKRAIQFGARTAKMQSGKTKGTTILS